MPTLNLPHQNRLCIGTKPAFNFEWIFRSTVSEVRCDCQGLGEVARIEAPILVFDTKQVLNWPVLEQIQFCSFDRRCKTCLDTKPVLYQGRFCSLTPIRQKHISTSWAVSHIGYNSESILDRNASPLDCLQEALAYRNHFVWRKHENMSPCTGSRVKTNYERIALWGWCQCWTGDPKILEIPLAAPTVAAIFLTTR